MVDSGCYLYGSASLEDQKWRQWFRSSVAHQTLTLNNQDISLDRKHILWFDSPKVSAVVFENQSYPELLHRRSILFIGRSHFLVHDEAIGKAIGAIGVHFQFAPGPVMMADLNVCTNYPTGANLTVKTFPQNRPIALVPEEGWVSYRIGIKEPRPAWRWQVEKKAKEEQPVEFLTALVPQREKTNYGDRPIEARVINHGLIRVYEISIDGKLERITIDIKSGTCVMVNE
jgi:heparan-sulfate lyase